MITKEQLQTEQEKRIQRLQELDTTIKNAQNETNNLIKDIEFTRGQLNILASLAEDKKEP